MEKFLNWEVQFEIQELVAVCKCCREYNVDCSQASKYFSLNDQLFASALQIIPSQVWDQHHHRALILRPNRSIPWGHSLVSGPPTCCTSILTSHLPYPTYPTLSNPLVHPTMRPHVTTPIHSHQSFWHRLDRSWAWFPSCGFVDMNWLGIICHAQQRPTTLRLCVPYCASIQFSVKEMIDMTNKVSWIDVFIQSYLWKGCFYKSQSSATFPPQQQLVLNFYPLNR